MAVRLSDIERKYFARKAGGGTTPQEPLGQLKRRYYADFLNASYGATMSELESNWKIKFITDAGGTVVSTYEPDLWIQMVLAISKVPTKRMTENKMTFFLSAP